MTASPPAATPNSGSAPTSDPVRAGLRSSVKRHAAERFGLWNRRRKAAFVLQYIRQHDVRSVLMVGTNSPLQGYGAIVEKAIHGAVPLAVGVDLGSPQYGTPWLSVIADGRALPFASGSVDLVFSNAVVEHVGDVDDQRRFIAEHRRVGRGWIVTTPNRWCPIESHTGAVFRHWSSRWRAAHRAQFTRLLSRAEFANLLPADATIRGASWSPTFMAVASPRGTGPLDGIRYDEPR
jgi:hypothetical protein